MELERDGKDNIVIKELPSFFAEVLYSLPEILENEDEVVKARLFPEAFETSSEQQEWERLVGPELAHLYQTRKEIVANDLDLVRWDSTGESFDLTIPVNHTNAWLSTLNAARLCLFIANGFSDEDMERDPFEMDDPEKGIALSKIHFMAFLQEVLLEHGSLAGF